MLVFSTANQSNFASTKTAAKGWLSYVNYHRALAGLPPVTENRSYSDGCFKHARYMAKNKIMAHDEDPKKPWYTPEGKQAAQSSNLVIHSANDRGAIDQWMTGPFHALGIIDPRLQQTGYGRYKQGGAAALDVIRGSTGSVEPSSYPVKWPKDNATTFLLSYNGKEIPNPLSHAPSYRAPSGLPIILQIGSGDQTPEVTSSSFSQGGKKLRHFVISETNYRNPNKSYQALGRSVLNSRDAVVVVPKDPLKPGRRYTVSITANGQTYTWSFKTK